MSTQTDQTILIINDEPDALELIAFILRQASYRVLTATDGQTGLETARAAIPDLIISDVMMPGMDGFELCRLIRRDAALKTTPVILVTAIDKNAESAVRGLTVGADDYMEVPFEPMRLVAKVARLLERRKSEEERQQFFNVSIDMLCVAGFDGYFKFLNPAWETTLGFTIEELLSKPYIEFIHPEDKEATYGIAANLEEGITVSAFENRYLCKSGSYKWLSWRSAAFKKNGTIYAVARDVTESKAQLEELKESKEQVADILESITDAFYTLDAGWNFNYVNAEAERLLMRSKEELLGRSIWEEFPAAAVSDFYPMYHRVANEKTSIEFTEFYPEPLNSWYMVKAYPAKDGISVYFRDVTEQRRAKAALEQSERDYRAIFEQAHDAIIIFAPENEVILDVNERACEIYGFSRTEFIGMSIHAISKNPERGVEKVQETLDTGEYLNFETVQYRRDGTEMFLEINASKIDYQGRPSIISINRDITERKLAEKTLRENQRVISTLMSNLPGMAYRCLNDERWTIEFASDGCLELTGYAPAELIRNNKISFFDLIHPDDQSLVWDKVQKAIAQNEPFQITYRLMTKSGKMKWVWEQGRGIYSYEGELLVLEGLIEDITERIRAEQALKEAEERYRSLVESSPGVVYLSDPVPPYSTIYISPNIETLGYPLDDWKRKRDMWASIIHEDDRERVLSEIERSMSQGLDTILEYRVVAEDGTMRWWHDKGRFVLNEKGDKTGWQGVIVDVTETKKLEEQLKQAQKLESVGRLAGGIAHDFNNMLTAINGYSDLTLRRMKEDDPLRRNVAEIKKAGERSAALTQQLLAFSRQQILQTRIIDLNDIITDTAKLLQRLIGEDIQLVTALNPNAGRIEADPGQLSQVIMNLAVNARDAMPQGGKLTIETSRFYQDEKSTARYVSLPPGRYVALSVSDTGVGMSKEIQERVFEPFFTTKEIGKGTGLGLATVYGIVKQSGGNIWVYSEEGLGTTFRVYFPLVENEEQMNDSAAAAETVPMGTETILLVEDEEIVRKLNRQMLEECGYTVFEAANGLEALAIIDQMENKIDLLLTDVVMPKMGGRELAEKLDQTHRRIKTLFMSGYTDDAVMRHGISEVTANFIQKPFTFDTLALKVREVLQSQNN
jgi:two-component system, cell cycle sensor histidine kinase and response regulator CckA